MSSTLSHQTGKLRRAYDHRVSRGQLEQDPSQVELIDHFDRLLEDLSAKRLSNKSSALGWLFGKAQKARKIKEQGLYIWGDVGRGKSMLMDMFFDLVPHKRKRRAHFNDFMQDAQERIHAHRQSHAKGTTQEDDPVPVVGREMSQESRILCFDEFTVTDIADAMILGRLFKVMFEEGVVVVATSNVAPGNLYRNGLNRSVFLPFIDLLQQNLRIVELNARTDYRLEKLNRAPVYHHPLGKRATTAIQSIWLDLTGVEQGKSETLALKGRTFELPEIANGVARLSFDEACRAARSAFDYLALARRIHTLVLTDIPVMDREDQNAAKRFILLIDTLYDNQVRLIVSAAAKPEGLYIAKSGTEAFEFKRTISRLHEMQSQDYIGARTTD